jgi:hypothetical protein
MELFTLNEAFRREAVVEGYNSCLWAERYSAWGDVEIVFPSDRPVRSLLKEGTQLGLDKSYRIMTVEDLEEGVNDDGEEILTVTGRSIESKLDDRAAIDPLTLGGTEVKAKWDLTGLPAALARKIFQDICVLGLLSPDDTFPFYTAGTLLPAGTIPEPTDSVTISLDPDTAYNSIKKICDIYSLGFRMVRNPDASQMFFEVYTGDVRTSAQTAFPAMIFSPELDNLSNTKQLTSISQLKNVAYVIGKNGSTTVFATGVDPEVTGFERRVLLVMADDIDLAAGSPELEAALQQKGLEELSKYLKIFTFDGEIASNNLRYMVDYDLGDIVEQRNADGFTTEMRVTEQIFVQDEEGERSYPTLTVNQVINPGSWLSWSSNQKWAEVPEGVFWANA